MFDQIGIETGEGNEALAPERGAGTWDDFVREHHRSVSRCVVRAMARTGCAARTDEVQELVQEVYCRLLERSDSRVSGRPEGQLWSYLQRIAYSVVVDHLRARHARKRGGWPPRAEVARALDDRRGLDEHPADAASPEQRALVRDEVRAVRRRVRQAFPGHLGERNLRVLELAAVEGLTAVEIAERLRGELTPSSVHTVLHRVRRLLTGRGPLTTAAAAG